MAHHTVLGHQRDRFTDTPIHQSKMNTAARVKLIFQIQIWRTKYSAVPL